MLFLYWMSISNNINHFGQHAKYGSALTSLLQLFGLTQDYAVGSAYTLSGFSHYSFAPRSTRTVLRCRHCRIHRYVDAPFQLFLS
jgi:hypothetical protein